MQYLGITCKRCGKSVHWKVPSRSAGKEMIKYVALNEDSHLFRSPLRIWCVYQSKNFYVT